MRLAPIPNTFPCCPYISRDEVPLTQLFTIQYECTKYTVRMTGITNIGSFRRRDDYGDYLAQSVRAHGDGAGGDVYMSCGRTLRAGGRVRPNRYIQRGADP